MYQLSQKKHVYETPNIQLVNLKNQDVLLMSQFDNGVVDEEFGVYGGSIWDK